MATSKKGTKKKATKKAAAPVTKKKKAAVRRAVTSVTPRKKFEWTVARQRWRSIIEQRGVQGAKDFTEEVYMASGERNGNPLPQTIRAIDDAFADIDTVARELGLLP